MRSTNQTIQVFGEGSVSIRPDTASILLGVETESPTLQEAQQDNVAKTNSLLEALYTKGVSKDNIQTKDYNIFPQYDYISGSQKLRGYQVRHIYSIEVSPNVAGEILDTAVGAGANVVQSIQFSIKDPTPYIQKALQNAYDHAYEKAMILAKQANMLLGHSLVPITISEPTNNVSVPFFETQANVKGVSTAIVPPSQQVVSSVISVIFQLR